MQSPSKNVVTGVALLAIAGLSACAHRTSPDPGPKASAAAVSASLSNPPPTPQDPPMAEEKTAHEYKKPTDTELREKLTPEQYEVTQQAGTERPFANQYWNNHDDGLYVDVATGEPLFSSRDKFESGTGWPSFTRPIDASHVVEKTDTKFGMQRTEVMSQAGASHLGHVFDDGPAPTGQRYCINSAALRFIPVGELEKQGYGQYLPLFKK